MTGYFIVYVWNIMKNGLSTVFIEEIIDIPWDSAQC